MPVPTLDDAVDLDRSDAIAALRNEFVIDDDAPIYADGNSLGRLCRRARAAMARLVDDEWGRSLITSWDSWFDLPLTVGDAIGTGFLGARPGETVVADSTTVNFYKAAVAALRVAGADRRIVITDRSNFPTDRFVLQALDADLQVVEPDPAADAIDVVLRANAGQVGLVTLSHVSYRSGALLDMPTITRLAHASGALVLWDLSHAVGAVEIDLASAGVDLAVGCTYKYLNAGPGAPAFLYVRSDHVERLAQPIPGWFGAADQFTMAETYAPAPGIRRFLSGTPNVAGLRAVEAAVATLSSVGIGPLADKGRTLTGFVIDCVDALLAPLGFDVVTPRDPSKRGAHVAVRHDDAWRICAALIRSGAVIPDFRAPDVVRLGFAPAYTRFVDAYEAIVRIRDVVASGAQRDMPEQPPRIT